MGIVMPSTCNYASMTKKNQCHLKYSGIKKLVEQNHVFHMTASRCSSPDVSEAFPAGAFGLSGSFVEAIKEPTPCDSKMSCRNSDHVCEDLWSIGYDGKPFMTSLSDSMDMKIDGAKVTPEVYLTKMYRTLLGTLIIGAEKDGVKPYDSDTSKAIFTTAAMKGNVRRFLLALAGKGHDSKTDTKFCFPDYQDMVNKAEAKFYPAGKGTDFDLTWLNANLMPTFATCGTKGVSCATPRDFVKMLEEDMTCDGCKAEDKLPGKDTGIYWKVTVPALDSA
jgi:hypothetical protein